MIRLFSLAVFCCLSVLLISSIAHAEGKPSACAKGMPGAKGTFELTPPGHKPGVDTYWIDTDGVAPNIAGCHIETDSAGKRDGRMFGEYCTEEGLLVESNPGAYAVHQHGGDFGHPDTFDCNEWCVGSGSVAGSCQAVGADVAPPCEASAMCVCDSEKDHGD